jgi:hypothetical protein
MCKKVRGGGRCLPFSSSCRYRIIRLAIASFFFFFGINSDVSR